MRTHRLDGVNLFFALVFIGLGALALVDVDADLDDLSPWLWSGALLVLGVAGLAATGARMAADRRAERERIEATPSAPAAGDADRSDPDGAPGLVDSGHPIGDR